MEQADIAEELLKKLKITQVHLLSHDYGDTVALELLARFDSLSRTQKCWSYLSYGMYLYSIGFLCWVNETEQNIKPWSYDWKSWYMYVKKTIPDSHHLPAYSFFNQIQPESDQPEDSFPVLK